MQEERKTKTKHIVKRISNESNEEIINNFLDVRKYAQLKFVGSVEFDTEKEALKEGLKIVSEAFDNNDKELSFVAITTVKFEEDNIVSYGSLKNIYALEKEVFTVELTGGKYEDTTVTNIDIVKEESETYILVESATVRGKYSKKEWVR